MIFNVGCIVEGYGEVKAVPVLLDRFRAKLPPDVYLEIQRPWRENRNRLVKPGELERIVEAVARRLQAPRAIFILIDADKDCPATLGPELLERATKARSDIPIGVVLAKCEFEAWFLASVESLHGHCEIESPEPFGRDPEGIRGAKQALRQYMRGNRSYSETVDQAELTRHFDLNLARGRSDSFDKCCREIERLFTMISEPPARSGPPNC